MLRVVVIRRKDNRAKRESLDGGKNAARRRVVWVVVNSHRTSPDEYNDGGVEAACQLGRDQGGAGSTTPLELSWCVTSLGR